MIWIHVREGFRAGGQFKMQHIWTTGTEVGWTTGTGSACMSEAGLTGVQHRDWGLAGLSYTFVFGHFFFEEHKTIWATLMRSGQGTYDIALSSKRLVWPPDVCLFDLLVLLFVISPSLSLHFLSIITVLSNKSIKMPKEKAIANG